MSGEPTPRGISLWTRARRHRRPPRDRARGCPRPRLPPRRGPCGASRPVRDAEPQRQGARGGARAPTSSTSTASPRPRRTGPSAGSAPRCRLTRASPCASRFFSSQEYRTASTPPTRHRRTTSTPSSASATTSTRDATSTATATTAPAPTPSAGRTPGTSSTSRVAPSDYRDKYQLYRTDSPLQMRADALPDVRELGRPRGREQLRGRRPGGGLVRRVPFLRAAPAPPPTAPSSSRRRSSPGARNRIYRPCASAARPTCSSWTSALPLRPALRRRRRAGLRRPRGRATLLGRTQMPWFTERARRLAASLEAHGQPADGHAGQGAGRVVLHLRQLAGLPAASARSS